MSKLWYAVMTNDNDDWGYGSNELNKAKQMTKELEDSNAYIAVIDTSDNDPICVAIIYQYEFDSYGNEFDEITYNVCVTYRSF